MKALTVWQPWASLILVGAKPFEFRSWAPPRWLVGQRLAIHAGARPVRVAEVEDLIKRLSKPDSDDVSPCLYHATALELLIKVRFGLHEARKPSLARTAFRLPLSAVIATAVVGEPMRGDHCARVMAGDTSVCIGNDSDRDDTFNWGWPLHQVEPVLPPVEMAGAQGLWEARLP